MDGDCDRAEDPPDDVAVFPAPDRRVEVDDVEATRAPPLPLPREGHGVVGDDLLRAALAAREEDRAPGEEVDCRDHVDGTTPDSRRNPRRTPAPTRPLFSGWNWAPNTRPRRTAAANAS